MSTPTTIHCPNCQTEIDINNVLTQQLEAEYNNKLQQELNTQRKQFQNQALALQKEKEAFEEKRKKENEIFAERFNTKVKEEREKIALELKEKLKQESKEQLAIMQQELNEKSDQLKEFNKAKVEIEKIKREKEELKDELEAKLQKKFNADIQEEREKIKKAEQEKNELRFKELENKLDEQKKLTEESKRKLEQGSMQLQGEVQELAIEAFLAENFPLDTIDEIKKGVRGADCKQMVNTYTAQNCGIIYYESKRTKDFQPNWIEKLKNDMRSIGANIGVLVTDTMPKNMERMGLLDGVWVCNFQEFKSLCFILRENIIAVHNAVATQENKGEKMVMLYNFLTSNEFRLQIEGIVEGFTQMQEDLISEKRSIMGQWKKREKQIEKVLLNTNFMYSAIKGIAGNAIQPIKILELPQSPDLLGDAGEPDL
jgi:hypothetical protein